LQIGGIGRQALLQALRKAVDFQLDRHQVELRGHALGDRQGRLEQRDGIVLPY